MSTFFGSSFFPLFNVEIYVMFFLDFSILNRWGRGIENKSPYLLPKIVGNSKLSVLWYSQKQLSIGAFIKGCSENMQQIYRRAPMLKCDFNKVVLELYWNHTSAWMFSCKFCCIFLEHLFLRTPQEGCFYILYYFQIMMLPCFLLLFANILLLDIA